MEEAAIASGLARIKFTTIRTGNFDSLHLSENDMDILKKTCDEMSSALWDMEKCGAAPVAPDGKVGGNAAALLPFNDLQNEDQQYLLVSKSGKKPNQRMTLKDACVVTKFCEKEWSVEYVSEDDEIKPTSDAPMHFTALVNTQDLEWESFPSAALHGHALETEEEAKKLNYPISTKETLFSTYEDSMALFQLMKKYPYPISNLYIRKGHGFIIVGENLGDTKTIFQEKVKPFLKTETSK